MTLLMSAGGVIQARYYYDAFGQVLEGSLNLPNPYLYSGYYYDHETELYDLRARFYDARIARFLQEDTFLGQSQDPLSLNRYTYCSNNASTTLMMDDYRKMDRLKSTSYIPKAGDTIFIQHPDTKHTGIVEYVEFIEEKQADGSIKEKVIIHTIAGNVRVPTDIKGLNHEWGVIRKQYESTNSTILGYGKNGATECDLREYYQQK